MHTRWTTAARGGLLAATLAACGGGSGSDGGAGGEGCPSGELVVELAEFGFAPAAGEEHLRDIDLRLHDVDVQFDVTNEASAPVAVEGFDMVVGLDDATLPWDEPRTFAAGETATLGGRTTARFAAASTGVPDSEDIEVDRRWSDQWSDCPAPTARVETAGVDEPTPITSTSAVEIPAPGPPPDALAIGETATFALPSGQEIRLTVTSVGPTGACPEPDAPPASIAYQSVGLRLEVGPGADAWRVHATSMNIGPIAMPSVNDPGGPCAGTSLDANNLQAGPGQTTEAVFVFDGVGAAVWYTFDAAGLDQPQTVSWAIPPQP